VKLNWNFLGSRGVQNKKPSFVRGVWIFSGTAHFTSIYPPSTGGWGRWGHNYDI